jgi:hypothetical protein
MRIQKPFTKSEVTVLNACFKLGSNGILLADLERHSKLPSAEFNKALDALVATRMMQRNYNKRGSCSSVSLL